MPTTNNKLVDENLCWKFLLQKGEGKKLHIPVVKTMFASKKTYTSVDPKQFEVSKFRLKSVILISEYFYSKFGHSNHPPCIKNTSINYLGNKTRKLQITC